MIDKPHPATMQAKQTGVPLARPATVATRAGAALRRRGARAPSLMGAMMAAWLAFGLSGGQVRAQTSVAPVAPAAAAAAAPASAAEAPPRDFDAERKAISDSRAWTNYRFSKAEHDCYSTFFVNHCVNKAKDAQREELEVLRKRDLEVSGAERAFKAKQRDERLALQRAQEEAERPQREADERASREAFEKKQQEQQLRDAERQGQAPQRAANAQAYEKKQSDFDARMKEAQQHGAEKAQQHAENAKAYEAKQRDAAQRQKELEERRAKAKQQGQASTPRPFGF